MLSLLEYGESDSEQEDEEKNSKKIEEMTQHLKPIEKPGDSISSSLAICATPTALPPVSTHEKLVR